MAVRGGGDDSAATSAGRGIIKRRYWKNGGSGPGQSKFARTAEGSFRRNGALVSNGGFAATAAGSNGGKSTGKPIRKKESR